MMVKSIEDQIDVWIVNDSKYMTQLLSDLISKNNIKVTNTARDGAEALRKLNSKKPDVILLDLEMPTMDGLTFIEEVVKQDKLVPIIVVSSFTQDGAKIVLDALENGALDFVPISNTNPENISELKENLISKIETAAKSEPKHLIIKNIEKLRPRRKKLTAPHAATRIIVIGSSTGGPNAVQSIISSLPSDLPAAILVVQHMPKEFTGPLALRLNENSDLPVKEAEDGDIIKEGTVLVAKGGYHMLVEPNMRIKLVDGPKRFGVKPAVNMTMVSASEVFGSNTIGILLTGMGHDGAFGMKSIKKRGGKTIAQDSSSSVIYGMPKAAVDLKAVDKLLPTEKIPETIQEEVEKLARE
jgi:two-component system, chemotaxis family, protein-glutamate methylesterase/glutaminase